MACMPLELSHSRHSSTAEQMAQASKLGLHDAAAVGNLIQLRPWRDHLDNIETDHGYYPNTYMTCFIVEEGEISRDKKPSTHGTDVAITISCRKHGTPIGTTFVKECTQKLSC